MISPLWTAVSTSGEWKLSRGSLAYPPLLLNSLFALCSLSFRSSLFSLSPLLPPSAFFPSFSPPFPLLFPSHCFPPLSPPLLPFPYPYSPIPSPSPPLSSPSPPLPSPSPPLPSPSPPLSPSPLLLPIGRLALVVPSLPGPPSR